LSSPDANAIFILNLLSIGIKKVYLGALESKFSGNLHDRFGSILRCPIAGFLALIVVGVLAEEIRREDPGTEKMRRIASYIEEGARAFLSREFKTITYFIIPFAFYYGSSYAGRYH